MKMKELFWPVAVLVVLMLASTQAEAARDFWTLDFKHTGLHYVRIGGYAVAYTTYSVTNNTGATRDFYPIFRVETDTRQLTYAMPDAGLAQAISRKHGMKLLDIGEISGPIKDGESKLGVAVFRRLDPRADHVRLYVTGLTNAFRYLDEDNRKGFQRRMWFVHWYRPGDSVDRPIDRVDTKFDHWIWRSTGTGGTAPVEEE